MKLADLEQLAANAANVAGAPTPEEAKNLVAQLAEAAATDAVAKALAPESLAIVRSIQASVGLLMGQDAWKKVYAASEAGWKAVAASVAMQLIPLVQGAMNASVEREGEEAQRAVAGASTPEEEASAKQAVKAAAYGALALTGYGAVFAVVASIAEGMAAQYEAEMAARRKEKAELDYQCAGPPGLARLMTPRGSGKDGAIVPADLFAFQSFPEHDADCKVAHRPKPYVHRPALGNVLIWLLEAGLDGSAQATQGNIEPPDVAVYRKANQAVTVAGAIGGIAGWPVSQRYFEPWAAAVRAAGAPYALSRETRLMFRALRLAMQAQRRVPGSDGGAALWPIYMDLLLAEVKAGRIPRDPNRLELVMFTRIRTPDPERPAVKTIGLDSAEMSAWPRPHPLARYVAEVIDRWEAAVDPPYAIERGERDAKAKLFVTLAKVEALRTAAKTVAEAAGKPAPDVLLVPKALYAEVPAKMRDELGIAPVVRPRFNVAPPEEKPSGGARASLFIAGGGALAVLTAIVAAATRGRR